MVQLDMRCQAERGIDCLMLLEELMVQVHMRCQAEQGIEFLILLEEGEMLEELME